MSDDTTALVLALATENAELRAALAEAQDLLVETAIDAGELHAWVEDLRAEMAVARGAAMAERSARCDILMIDDDHSFVARLPNRIWKCIISF